MTADVRLKIYLENENDSSKVKQKGFFCKNSKQTKTECIALYIIEKCTHVFLFKKSLIYMLKSKFISASLNLSKMHEHFGINFLYSISSTIFPQGRLL